MLGSVLGATAAATALTLGPAGTSGAVQRADPLEGLTVHPEWGSITGRPGVLRKGCRTYHYDYSTSPPEGVWAIEVHISGPGLESLAAGAFLDGYDPTTGTGHYTLCRNSTRYGRFTIRAKVSVDDGSGHITEGLLPVDHYRLHRPHRHRPHR